MTIALSSNTNILNLSSIPISRGIAVLILAKDEAGVITETVQSVRAALESQDAIFVIADHCRDDTALRAAVAGATVFIRSTGIPDGKGAAMHWFLEQEADRLQGFELAVILDADTFIEPDFLIRVRNDYQEGTVMQCLVQPSGYQLSPLATLIALSDIYEQHTIDCLRSWLGWPVRLRGTGMVFSLPYLQIVASLSPTEVEDIALSLLLTSQGIPIRRNERLRVYDPKPTESILASNQRARWFRGQWGVLRQYRCQAWNIILQGPPGWSMLGSLFFKPRWLADLLLLLMASIIAPFFWPLSVVLSVRVVFDFASLGLTILTSDERGVFLRAILHTPAFIFMWLRSFLLAFHKASWLRART